MSPEEYRRNVILARKILWQVSDLIGVAHDLVKDDDGAFEQATKRISEAHDKVQRACELLKV